MWRRPSCAGWLHRHPCAVAARQPPHRAGRSTAGLGQTRQKTPAVAARFAGGAGEAQHAGDGAGPPDGASPMPVAERPAAIALPAVGSPLGTIEVNKDRCTLCLSCVSACPPVRCRTTRSCRNCASSKRTACSVACAPPPARKTPLPAAPPAAHARARKPRCSTRPSPGLRALQQTLWHGAGHRGHAGQARAPMFQGEALERLKMCSDCRVIDLYSSQSETKPRTCERPTCLPLDIPGGSSALDEETARAG